jgi:hypothetical protein
MMNNASKIFLDILKSALAGKAYEPGVEISAEQWEQIFRIAQQHQLLPAIVDACYRWPDLAGTELLTAVRSSVRQQVFTQARKTAEFLELYRNLRQASIQPLVVKGIICRNLYPNPDHRTSSDEDVLIRPEEFNRCHEAMIAFGMETEENPARFEQQYEIPYRKKGGPLYIELHKSLFAKDRDAYGELNGYFEQVHETAVEVTVEGERILTMAPTDHLFYLICHSFKHFLHGGFGIRQVGDIALFARHYGEQICWERVLENCRKIRADRFAAALFAIGERHLGVVAALPEFWQTDVDEKSMLEDLLSSGIYGKTSLERQHSAHMTLNAVVRRKQGKDERGGVLKSLFPGAGSLESRYPYLKKYPALLPVAWVSRIVRFAAKGGSESAKKTVQLGNERLELLKRYGILDE